MPVRSIPDADGRERVAGFMNFSTPSPVNTGQMQETPARPFLPKAAGNIILHKKKYSQDKNEVESPHSEFLLTCCLPACLLLLTAAYFRLLRLTLLTLLTPFTLLTLLILLTSACSRSPG